MSQQYRRSNQLLFLQGSSTSARYRTPPVLYDFEKSSWFTFQLRDVEVRHREDSTYVSHAGIIYCIEGQYQECDDEGESNSIGLGGQVYTLTLENRQMEKHSNLNVPRKRHQSVLVGDRLYVLGGSLATSIPTNSVEYLDLTSKNLQDEKSQWKQGPNMLTKRVSHMAVELDNCIYVLGGWDGQGIVKTVEKLDLSASPAPSEASSGKEEWSTVTEYPDMRMKSGCAVLDGCIYLVGGCVQTLETCYKAEVYNPRLNTWKQLPETHFARSNPVLAPYRGKLYVFGGEGNSGGQVECYDPCTNKWSVLSKKVKHFYNGFYSGCLIEKPWNFDLTIAKDVPLSEQLLFGVGLETVRSWQSLQF
eukprot:TRINITY_DN5733_c0_g1_i6.p1 TRINITY_DN5733_c0_g1~~TRINITY_DN5733_c0_g1_i6.p1  ORF type:complete len:361 (-),score=57.94 TRINITY_DN5733_c0_g1_i6:104-1186(-)